MNLKHITMSDYTISLQTGIDYTTNWREAHPDEVKAFKSDKAEMLEILNIEGAEGVRSYMGLDDEGNAHLVMVAVDENGDDMLETIYDHTESCPTNCDVNSVLNTGE
jgi:hypothetical protein